MAGTASVYALDILSCPPSGAIKSIVYATPTQLAVVEGAATLISIDLSSFFVPITNAQQTTFVLTGSSATNVPLSQYSFDYCGLNENSTAKFAAFFPSYPSSVASNLQYIQWAFLNELEEGSLATLLPVLIDDSGSTAGATGSDSGYDLVNSNNILKIDGQALGLDASSAIAIATRGGLKLWSAEDPMVLFNTFNSSIPSNDVRCMTVTPDGVLWVGTDAGIAALSWGNSAYTFTVYDESNSSLISEDIQDIFYSAGILAIATAAGISLYNVAENTWENFSKLNVNEIDVDSFTSVKIDGIYIVAGSESGVFVYNTSTEDWSVYDSAVTGWTSGNYVNRIESFETEVFAGTTAGIVTFTIGGTSCSEISLPVSMTGPYTSISGLVYAAGASGDTLYVSHTEGAISAYDITGATWSFAEKGITGSLLADGVTQIAIDEYVFFSNSSGFGRFATDTYTVNALPLSSQNSDILFSYPSDGDFPVALNQKLYVGFSKAVDSTVLQSHSVFKKVTTGATFSMSLTASSSGSLYAITLGATLDYATKYNFSIVSGLTATDSTYFRQTVSSTFYSFDKNPALGWRVAGKQLLLTGAEEHLLSPLVFRNPQTFNVNVLTLVAV